MDLLKIDKQQMKNIEQKSIRIDYSNFQYYYFLSIWFFIFFENRPNTFQLRSSGNQMTNFFFPCASPLHFSKNQ